MGTFLLGFLWPILLICLGLNLYLVHLRILLCCCSAVKLCPTLCNPVDCSTPGFPIFHQLSELAQTHVHWVSDAIQPSHPLPPLSPPALNLSQHQGFSNESVLYIRWPKYWSFSFSIGPSHEYSGLISFRMDWFDLLAVQGTLQSLLQHQMCSHKSLSQGGFQQRGLWVALASLFFWPARNLLVKKGSLTLRMTNT